MGILELKMNGIKATCQTLIENCQKLCEADNNDGIIGILSDVSKTLSGIVNETSDLPSPKSIDKPKSRGRGRR